MEQVLILRDIALSLVRLLRVACSKGGRRRGHPVNEGSFWRLNIIVYQTLRAIGLFMLWMALPRMRRATSVVVRRMGATQLVGIGRVSRLLS